MALTGHEWYVKFYRRIKWHIKEFSKTFSNEPSYYSTKRIERFFLFLNGIVIFDAYIYTHWSSITFDQALEAFIVNLAYAGYLLTKAQTEKKFESTNKSSSDASKNNNEPPKTSDIG
jgi:acyl carrier protein phosphodiesterase